jgi:hypothetical protein
MQEQQTTPIKKDQVIRIQYNPPNNSPYSGETHELQVYFSGNIQLMTTQISTNLAYELHGRKPKERPSRELRFWQTPSTIERIAGFSIEPRTDKVAITFYDEKGTRILQPLSLAYPERGQLARLPEQRI